MEKLNLCVRHVSKAFRGQSVLKDISLDMEGGRIYGLIGRNGSGKSVLLKMICGEIQPDEGTISIQDKPVICGKLLPFNYGVLLDAAGFIPTMSGYRNLKLLAGIRNIIGNRQIRTAIETVGLDPDDKKHVGKYSLGMKQRLAFAQAVMEDPDVLLFDEPMNGLDASAMEHMRKLIRKQSDRGKLIIIATHIREDIETLCDVVFQIADGQVSRTGLEQTEGLESSNGSVLYVP